MADDDDDLFDDDDAARSGEDGDAEGDAAGPAAGNALGITKESVLKWLTRKRWWLLFIGIAAVQAVFGSIIVYFRSFSTPVEEVRLSTVANLAVDMLGHEVKIGQMYQVIPVRGGRRMTVGLDMVLILGQLPAEQIQGAPRADAEELTSMIAAIQMLEPNIRSRVNMFLQRTPAEEMGRPEVQESLKQEIKTYLNDTLERLDFSGQVRPDIDKRRVTDVLLPMFIVQYM